MRQAISWCSSPQCFTGGSHCSILLSRADSLPPASASSSTIGRADCITDGLTFGRARGAYGVNTVRLGGGAGDPKQ